MRKIGLPVFFLCILLAGCVSRQDADARISQGCEAGVQALLPEGQKIDRVVDRSYSSDANDKSMRTVKLKTVTINDGVEEDGDYQCTFDEEFGFAQLSYAAELYQIKIGDAVYGKDGGEIKGDIQDFVKLTEAVQNAMNAPASGQ